MASGNELPLGQLLSVISGANIALSRNTRNILPSNQRSRYTTHDLDALVKRTTIERDPEKQFSFNDKSPQSLIQYFQPVHEHIGEVIRDAERFKELGPEIAEAAEILTSCILSPNDLQSGDPSFSIDGAHEFDQDTYNELIKFLSDFFNNDYKIGKKIKGWIHEALFRSGAKVLLTLPERSLAALFATDKDRLDAMEAGTEIIQKLNLTKRDSGSADVSEAYEKDDIQWLKLAKDRPVSRAPIGVESKAYARMKSQLSNKLNKSSLLRSLEVRGLDVGDAAIVKAVESFTVKFATELEDGDILHISENPEIVRFGKQRKADAKNKASNAIYSSMFENWDTLEEQPFISLLNVIGSEEPSQGHPLTMEIPTEACIPVCVPGAKEEKLGYFILIDEFGYPLEAHRYLCEGKCDCNNNAAAAAFSSMYGSGGDASGKLVFAGGLNKATAGDSFDPRSSAIGGIFDYVLDITLQHRLQNMGLGQVDVAAFNSISACMLKRFLEKKRTCLVYVPANFITYLAYEYREDGTGKSKLESIKTLLSIRATLMVAGMLGATNAAIPHKKIEFNADQKDMNIEQTIQTVLEMATLKANGPLQLGVPEITTGIIDRHLTVVPKNMAGIVGMEIDKSETQSMGVRVDENLLETITKMIVTQLEVPPAALNQTSEAEFSRSVATTNIYFSNKIATKQSITCDILSDHCKTMLRNDPLLLEGMYRILSGRNAQDITTLDLKNKEKDKASSKLNLENGVLHLETAEKDIVTKMAYVIDNLRMVLPSPNVAADKTQHEEAQAIMNLINQYIDSMYSSALFTNDSDLADAYTVMIASLKMTIFREVANSIGIIGTFDLPTLEDMAEGSEEVMEMHRVLRNFKSMLDHDKILQTREPTLSEGNDITNESSGDSSSDFSMDGGDDWGAW